MKKQSRKAKKKELFILAVSTAAIAIILLAGAAVYIILTTSKNEPTHIPLIFVFMFVVSEIFFTAVAIANYKEWKKL